MCRARHPSVVATYGGVVMDGSMHLVQEVLREGSLDHMLGQIVRGRRSACTFAQLDVLAMDIAAGCHYLTCLEPPIASRVCARTVMVSSFAGQLRPKVLVHASGPVPPTCFAPEAIVSGVHDAASDAYALGMVLHHIFSLTSPFETECMDGMPNNELVFRIVNEKMRPVRCASVPQPMQDFIEACWQHEAEKRPTWFCIMPMLRAALDASQSSYSSEMLTPSDDLLMSMFPAKIVKSLKSGQSIEPDYYESAAVLFCDVCSFTSMSSNMQPMKVADMLSRLFTRLDHAVARHDLFKVETIGDAYMVAGGIPDPQPDYVRRVAAFALEAIQASSETLIDPENPSLGNVQLRIGFHVGPVSGVVVSALGRKYTLLGDTVNVASRMESNSTEGRVTMSRAARRLLFDQAPEVRSRSLGVLDIKGKGPMQCFELVDDEHNHQVAAASAGVRPKRDARTRREARASCVLAPMRSGSEPKTPRSMRSHSTIGERAAHAAEHEIL
jgi:class 3 adenylate cyclase